MNLLAGYRCTVHICEYSLYILRTNFMKKVVRNLHYVAFLDCNNLRIKQSTFIDKACVKHKIRLTDMGSQISRYKFFPSLQPSYLTDS